MKMLQIPHTVYGKQMMFHLECSEWHHRFKDTHELLDNYLCSGWSATFCSKDSVRQMQDVVHSDYCHVEGLKFWFVVTTPSSART
jgi:hypothetical protein